MIAGLHPRNGLYGHLDHPCDCPVDRGYPIRRSLSRILAAGYVSDTADTNACCSPTYPSHSYGLNSNYGTADDLKDLASELHKRGMYLMVDVVANHMVSHDSAMH